MSESNFKECPNCGKNIKAKAIFCRFCHSDLTKSIPNHEKEKQNKTNNSLIQQFSEANSYKEFSEKETKKCPICSAIIKKKAIFCRYCNSNINPINNVENTFNTNETQDEIENHEDTETSIKNQDIQTNTPLSAPIPPKNNNGEIFSSDRLIPSNIPSKNQESLNQIHNTKICPFCSSIIKQNAVFCRYCKTDIKDEKSLIHGDSDAHHLNEFIDTELENTPSVFSSTTNDSSKSSSDESNISNTSLDIKNIVPKLYTPTSNITEVNEVEENIQSDDIKPAVPSEDAGLTSINTETKTNQEVDKTDSSDIPLINESETEPNQDNEKSIITENTNKNNINSTSYDKQLENFNCFNSPSESEHSPAIDSPSDNTESTGTASLDEKTDVITDIAKHPLNQELSDLLKDSDSSFQTNTEFSGETNYELEKPISDTGAITLENEISPEDNNVNDDTDTVENLIEQQTEPSSKSENPSIQIVPSTSSSGKVKKILITIILIILCTLVGFLAMKLFYKNEDKPTLASIDKKELTDKELDEKLKKLQSDGQKANDRYLAVWKQISPRDQSNLSSWVAAQVKKMDTDCRTKADSHPAKSLKWRIEYLQCSINGENQLIETLSSYIKK